MNAAAAKTLFSERSLEAGLLRPGRKLLCGTESSWRSVLLQTFKQPGTVEAFETTASPDHLFVFCLQGRYQIESFACGKWKAASYSPGLGGYTAPGTQNRLRWFSAEVADVEVLRLYIPDAYFQEAAEELRSVGRSGPPLPDCLLLPPSSIFPIAKSLLEQMTLGFPDLYADAGARFLAAHVLLSQKSRGLKDRSVAYSSKADPRTKRAFDFLQHHFREDLKLPQIAREAGISPFHFSREYKAHFGHTPHRHQIMLRMKYARRLLVNSNMAVQQVARDCGYTHCGHFAAAFRAEFGATPVEFRKRSRSSVICPV